MVKQKQINKFLKDLPIARHLDSIHDINIALDSINTFTAKTGLMWSEYPKALQTRYNSLCNKRRRIWNNCLK